MSASFEHRALLYVSREELVEAMAPFLREGVADGDAVFVATTRANAGALREALGVDARAIDFADAETWYTRPAETLDRYRRRVERRPAGTSARVLGEPTWRGSQATRLEWARYESALNVAFQGTPLSLVCPYDASALPDSVLEHAQATHPELVGPDGPQRSHAFVEPAAFPAAVGRPGDVRVLLESSVADADELDDVRRAVSRFAAEAGLAPARRAELALAVHELASNALRHGRPPARVRLGLADDRLVCEVADGGSGIADPLAGWLPRNGGGVGGWGLVLARRFADGLEIGPGASVRVHVDCVPAAGARAQTTSIASPNE
ncbi:MAG TPA: sensor histidine kinase [Gaiellaceae bacterium]|nr:sensor histidine kinase [Gaiellaceae bacterium]